MSETTAMPSKTLNQTLVRTHATGRRLASLAGLIAFALILSGCGGNGADVGNASTPDTASSGAERPASTPQKTNLERPFDSCEPQAKFGQNVAHWPTALKLHERGMIDLNDPIPTNPAECGSGKPQGFSYAILRTAHPDSFRLMIEYGLDVDVTASDGHSVLMKAFEDDCRLLGNDDGAVLDRIIENTTNPNMRRGVARTPLGTLAETSYCSNVDVKAMTSKLLQKGADPNALQITDRVGGNHIIGGYYAETWVPVLSLASRNNLDVYEALIGFAGTDINSSTGLVANSIANVLARIEPKHGQSANELVEQKIRILRAFAARGGNLNIPATDGNPVWVFGAANPVGGNHNHVRLMSALKEFGANLDAPDDSGRTYEEQMIVKGWDWALDIP